jgi:hypothetical protein
MRRPPRLPEALHSDDEDGDGDEGGWDGTKRGIGAETNRSGGLSIYSPRTIFSLLGEGWTREGGRGARSPSLLVSPVKAG